MEESHIRDPPMKCPGANTFLIFINDMPEVLNCCIKLFADDAKLYSPIKEENDRIGMQVGLKMLKNGPNYGKCCSISKNAKIFTLGKIFQTHNISCQWTKTQQK